MNLMNGLKNKKAMAKNTWYNFKEKQPPKDAEILVYGNKLQSYVHQVQNLYFALTGNELSSKRI